MNKVLNKIDSLIGKIEEGILAYGIILLTLITTGNAISRKFFNYSWSSAEESTQFLLVIITFMGISILISIIIISISTKRLAQTVT